MELELAPFLVDAGMLVDFQACRRRYLLSREWRPIRWVPKSLFDSCLRQAIIELSTEKPLKEVISDASTRYMNTAAQAGLNVVGKDPYTVAQDFVAMLETILHVLDNRPKPKLSPIQSVRLSEGLEWSFLSYQDAKGELHRTITVDRWDDDRLAQELHSWIVFGDIAASRKPMHLQVIEIGQMREGRRHSPWVRGWQHEYVPGRLRFQKKSTKAKGYTKLEGAWKPVFLADSTHFNAAQWVDLMEQDGIADTLIHEIEVSVPNSEHIKAFKRDVKVEARQMLEWKESIPDPLLVPMSRSACDSPYPCSYQAVCFSPIIDVDIRQLGLYKPRL